MLEETNVFDYDKELAEVPKSESKTTGLGTGKYTALILVEPQMNKDGTHATKKLVTVDGPTDKDIPLFLLHFFILGEGRINISPKTQDGKIVGVDINIPSHYGMDHLEWMNDNNLKAQFRKNRIADNMDCKTDSGTLSYNKLNGKICTIELSLDQWFADNNAGKKKYIVNFIDEDCIKPSVYHIERKLNLDTNQYEPASQDIGSFKMETVMQIKNALQSIKDDVKAKKETSKVASSTFNASDFDEDEKADTASEFGTALPF